MRPLRSPASCLAVALILSVLAAVPAFAAWPHSSTVNLLIPSPGMAGRPQAAEDGNGGAFVVWEDSTSAGVSQGIDLRAHHVLRGGTMDPAWGSTGIAICTSTGQQTNTRVAPDKAGGFYVVWQDTRSGTADIYALRVNSAGSRVSGWNANGNLVGGVSGKTDSLLCIDVAPDGSLYAAWNAVLSATDTDPYAQHMSAAGTVVSGWPATGLDFYGGTNFSGNITLAAVATGGADVAYQSNASGNYHIIGGRISAAGTTLWSANFVVLAGQQTSPCIVEDGAGGCIVAWSDDRDGQIWATRFTSSGALAAGWTPGGNKTYSDVALNTGGPLQMLPDGEGGAFITFPTSALNIYVRALTRVYATLQTPWDSRAYVGGSSAPIISDRAVPDGNGGVILTSSYSDGADFDVTSLAVAADGTAADGWPSNLFNVSNGISWQTEATAVTDGENGVIAFFTDSRNGVDRRVYAQRVARFGRLGSPDPTITGVKDVRNDQGGQVELSWTASYLDSPGGEVTGYRVWREVPSALAQSLLANGNAVLARSASPAAVAAAAKRELLATTAAGATYYWEAVGTVAAAGLTGYSLVVATEGDSVAGSNPYTRFAVSSYTAANLSWMSAPDSGYSVDNLPPAAPAPFSGTYTPSSGTFLTWGANAAADLAGYRLYRGSSAGFTPGPSNLVAALATTSYQDGTTGAVYKLSAVDVHGNEGPYALAVPGGAVDVPRTAPLALALHPVAPNPARGAVTIGFCVPAEQRVTLSVLDAQGRRVCVLADGVRAAREWTMTWDGRDASGTAVRPGLYLVRLQAGNRELTQRVVRVE